MKRSIYLLIFFFLTIKANSQFKFTIKGSVNNINSDTVTVKLLPNLPMKFINQIKSLEMNNYYDSFANNGFVFEGKIEYPHLFRLQVSINDNSLVTPLFFIDSGINKININIDSHNKIVVNMSGSLIQEEYTNKFTPYIYKSSKIHSELQELYDKTKNHSSDSLDEVVKRKENDYCKSYSNDLKNYSIKNPESLIPFFILANYIVWDKHANDFIEPFDLVNNKIIKTPIWNWCENQVSRLKKVIHQNKLNILMNGNYETTNGDSTLIKLKVSSFILIDLWYSNCGPCKKQFPELIDIYKKYNEKGFEIIGISIDSDKFKNNWLKTIKEYNLTWPQYLDKGGKVCQDKLLLTKYPTNYLIDKSGNVIRENITPESLKDFLEKNIIK